MQDSDTHYLSLIHCEIERTDSETMDALQRVIKERITTLDTVVGDWQAMCSKLKQITEEMDTVQVPEVYLSYAEETVQINLVN